MDRRKVLLVAAHESMLIRRSFLFWVLCSLSIGGITLLQWLVQGKWQMTTSVDAWLMKCQAFSLPLANAYLYNIMQAFILVFVATEIFIRAQRQGSLEALSARPIGNGEWVFGKALGVIYVFFGVGICSTMCCIGIHLLGSNAPFQASYYLFYFLTLTLPSLIFFTGLSLYLSWLIRYWVLTMGVLLGILFCSVVVLSNIWHGVFDFTGSGLSNLFSVATGHVDWVNYILHRLGYLTIGVGLIWSLVRLQRRLPNSRAEVRRLTVGGVGLLLLGIFLVGSVLYGYLLEDHVRDSYRAAFVRHINESEIRITNHNIAFMQQKDRIASTSGITLYNPQSEKVSRLMLYLNPGLAIESIEEAGKALSFDRDEQVVIIHRPLLAGDSVCLQMRYSGKIDERFAYLETNDAMYRDTRRGNSFFHFGRRYALVSDEALVLIPELLWYPMAVAPVNIVNPALTKREYTRFRLQVVDPIHQVVLSQGECRQQGDTIEFTPSSPLEGLSLCGGKYKHAIVDMDGFLLDLYYFEENDFLSPLLSSANKQKLVFAIKQELGRAMGDISHSRFMKRLTFVETPLPFVAHSRIWKGRSERVQPEMLLFNERLLEVGGSFSPDVFKRYEQDSLVRYRLQANLLTRPFTKRTQKNFMQHPFLRQMHFYQPNTNGLDGLNTHECAPLFKEPNLTVTSVQYGAIDRILKLVATKYAYFSQGMDMLDYNDVEALLYLQSHTLEEALCSKHVKPIVLERLFEMKAKDLISRLDVQVERKDFLNVLNDFFNKYHGEIPLDTLSVNLQIRLGLDFDKLLSEWASKELPRYRIADLKVEIYPVKGYVASFYIQNTGKVTGTVNCLLSKDDNEVLVLAPGDCKRVRLLCNSNSFTLDLGLSGNLPSIIMKKATSIHTMEMELGIWDVSPEVFDRKNEIVVDNEDAGFCLILPITKLLQKYFDKEPRFADGFYGMGPIMEHWGKIHAGSCYGEYVKSAYVKTVGKGAFKAEWIAEIPEEGEYEVLIWCPRIPFMKTQSYVIGGEGQEEQKIDILLREGEWNSLGVFDFKRGESYVILSDQITQEEKEEQSNSQVGGRVIGKPRIVADAVKWVPLK